MEGGGKEGTLIHDRVVKELQEEHGYSHEDAKAIKSILYDEAKDKVSMDEPGYNLKRAEYMLKLVTKKRLSKITDEELQARIQKIKEHRENKPPRAGRKKSKKAPKKISKRKTSKKAGSKKRIRKTSVRKPVRKTSVRKPVRKTSVRKTSVKRKVSKK
jgi:hypothetical protein